MKPFISAQNLRFSLFLCLTAESISFVNCLPTYVNIEGKDRHNVSEKSDLSLNEIWSDDRLCRWSPLRECMAGNANLMRHINVGLRETQHNHFSLHDALQFDIDCPDGKSTKYTVEFAQTDQQSTDVVRRFGFYQKIVRVYKEAKIEFNVTELLELTATHRDYNLDTFNSQAYARQTFLRIVDQMCVKLGFYADNEQDMLYADGPKWQTNQNFCRNALVPTRLDQSLLFSKYCLIFLLLIIGSVILLINIYLRYKSNPRINELRSANNYQRMPTIESTSNLSNDQITTGQSRDCNGVDAKSATERRNQINLNYNTFEIQKHWVRVWSLLSFIFNSVSGFSINYH